MKMKITYLALLGALFFGGNLQAQCNGATFEEKNGIVVIEAESVSLTSSWKKETGSSGYTGSGFITWRGNQYFNTPGVGTIQYKVKINTPGTYHFIWRNKVGYIADHNPTTEHNDAWLRIPDADDFYGQKSNGHKVFPGGSGKSPTPAGASSNGWFKIYVNSLNWDWKTATSDHDSHSIYAKFNSAGVYTIQVSARSSGHYIDRMVMYKVGSYSLSNAQSLSRSEMRCDGSTTPTTPTDPDPPVTDMEISSVQTVNADEDEIIGTLSSGSTINLASIDNAELSFKANTSPSNVGSVKFVLTGPRNFTNSDNTAPYALANNGGSNYYGLSLPTGNYTLKVTPYSGSNGSGSAGDSKTYTFAVSNSGNPTTPTDPDPPTTGDIAITDVESYNADKDTKIGALVTGSQISLAAINNAELTFKANTSGSVGSVKFALTGPRNFSKTDNSAAFTMVGNNGSNFYGIDMPAGNYTLKMTPYSGANGSGSPGSTKTITFSVSNSGNPTTPTDPDPPTTGGIAITDVESYNADKDTKIGALVTGSQISLAAINNAELTFKANTSGSVGSVKFALTGPRNFSKTDNSAAFTMVGNNGSNFYGIDMPAGNYTLKMTPYSGSNGTGSSGSTKTITFSVTNSGTPTTPTDPDPPTTGGIAITDVESYNADKDTKIGALVTGSQISLAAINNAELTFKANTSGSVGSVKFALTGPRNFSKTDNSAAFTMVGNNGSNFYGIDMPAGNYTLKMTPYSGSNGTGSSGSTKTITFSVVNNGGSVTPPSTTGVVSFVLVNASSNTDIATITNGKTFYTGSLPSSLSIKAVTNPGSVGTVVLKLSGPVSKTTYEGIAPYYLFGDIGVNPVGQNLPAGNYTVSANPSTGSSLSVSFKIVNGSSAKTATANKNNLAVGATPQAITAATAYAYPNPFLGSEVTVELPEEVSGDIAYYIIDASGAVLLTDSTKVNGSSLKVDASKLTQNGVYYLVVNTGISQYSVPVIKK